MAVRRANHCDEEAALNFLWQCVKCKNANIINKVCEKCTYDFFYFSSASMGSVYVHIYTRTYARAGPYVLGIILGYLLYRLRGKELQIPKVNTLELKP